MYSSDTASQFNCTCIRPTIVSRMGVDRCVACGKLAGRDAFVTGWATRVITKRRKGVVALPRACNGCDTID